MCVVFVWLFGRLVLVSCFLCSLKFVVYSWLVLVGRLFCFLSMWLVSVLGCSEVMLLVLMLLMVRWFL